jgi:hypothetical protein
MEHFLGLEDLQFGWGEILRPRLEVCNLPFYPKGMLVEPFVRILASEMNRCLSAEDSGTITQEEKSLAMASLP